MLISKEGWGARKLTQRPSCVFAHAISIRALFAFDFQLPWYCCCALHACVCVCVFGFFRVLSRKSGYSINLIYSSPNFSLRDESLYQQCIYIMKNPTLYC
jgi:hypothetical protein